MRGNSKEFGCRPGYGRGRLFGPCRSSGGLDARPACDCSLRPNGHGVGCV